MYETPLVQVCAEGEWSADFDALITYRLLQSFPSSAWDWIGLYKVREVPKMFSVLMGSQTAGQTNACYKSILLCIVTTVIVKYCELDFIQGFFNIELVFATSQVGFKSISDYITYTWVKDDQVSFNDELFQVCSICCQRLLLNKVFIFSSRDQLSRLGNYIVFFHRFMWTKMKFQFVGENVCCAIIAATCSALWVLVNLSGWVKFYFYILL